MRNTDEVVSELQTERYIIRVGSDGSFSHRINGKRHRLHARADKGMTVILSYEFRWYHDPFVLI